MTEPGAKIFSIRETNARIRAIVERETLGKSFWIKGIVRKHYISDLGHEYFELYDEDYSIRCMVREAVRDNLSFTITNGMELEICGTIRIYDKSARLEMEVQDARWIDSILPVLNEDIQARLEKRGLWPHTKQALPHEITKIGLVTSKRSDAKDDFYETYHQQGGTAAIDPVYVRIQGQKAPREIADKINLLNLQDDVDVIVLTRGGGRDADLEVFSDYLIAEAICRSHIPIVTGIGHSSNQTFADLAADVHTITPTAAATLLAKNLPAESQVQTDRNRKWATIAGGILAIILVIAVLFTVIVYL